MAQSGRWGQASKRKVQGNSWACGRNQGIEVAGVSGSVGGVEELGWSGQAPRCRLHRNLGGLYRVSRSRRVLRSG